MTVTVSVIIPAFNAQDLIGDAIRSVLEQTRQDFEIIVCDDKSTDATPSVVESLARQETRIRLLRNATNRGVSHARNVAIEAAVGDWIAILDADDYYHAERLKALLGLAETSGADVVCDDLIYVSPNDGTILGTGFPRGEVAQATELTAETFIAKSSRLQFKYAYLKPIIRKDFMDRHALRYDESLPVSEDFDLLARCLIKGGRCVLSDRAYYFYRLMPNSACRVPREDGYELSCRVDQALLEMPEVKSNPALGAALRDRQAFFSNVREFNFILELVKRGKLWRASMKLCANLSALPLFVRVFLRNAGFRASDWARLALGKDKLLRP